MEGSDGIFYLMSYDRFLISHNATLEESSFFEDEDVELSHLIFAGVTVSFIPFILIHNSLVFWGTLLYPGFNTPNNILLFSLCIADFFMGAWTIPMYTLGYLEATKEAIFHNKYLCLSWFASIEVSGGGSLNNLLAISFDRYIAVMWPLQYRSIMTPDRAYKIVFVIWTYIFFMSFIPMFGWNHYDDTLTDGPRKCNFYLTLPKNYVYWAAFFTVYSCITISFILYIQIIFVVYRQVRRFRQESLQWQPEQQLQFKNRVSSVKITSALMFTFILLWLPYILIAPFKYNKIFAPKTIEVTKVYAQILYFGNAMVNAPIYAIGRREYRQVYVLMLITWPWRWKSELRSLYTKEVMIKAGDFVEKLSDPGQLSVKSDENVGVEEQKTPSEHFSLPSGTVESGKNDNASTIVSGDDSVDGRTNVSVYEFLGTKV